MSVRKLSSEHFENCDYFGDKLVIHKCVIDAAIKRIKNDSDPYGDADVRHELKQTLCNLLGVAMYSDEAALREALEPIIKA